MNTLANKWVALLAALFFSTFYATVDPLLAADGSRETGKQAVDSKPYHFTLLTEPADAKVEILNLKTPYQPNMLLKPGRYHMVVSAPGYETEKGFIDIVSQDWIGKVVLHPVNGPAQAEGTEAPGQTAQQEDEWRKIKEEQEKLEQQRRAIAQEQDKLETTRKEMEQARQTIELARKEREKLETASKELDQARQSVDLSRKELEQVDLARKELDQARKEMDQARKEMEKREMALAAREREARPHAACPSPEESKPVAENKPVAESKPTAEREVSKPAPPIPTPAPQANAKAKAAAPQEEATARPAIVGEESLPAPAAREPAPEQTAATAPVTAPEATETVAPREEEPVDKKVAAVLAEATRYFQAPRPPQSGPPPESEEILRRLRQVQKANPTNPAIEQALQLHAKRYIAYTGLFELKERADAMERRIQALGIPAFQQSMIVKGRPASRICIGPFLTQEEANKNLRHLRENLETKDFILRIYKQ